MSKREREKDSFKGEEPESKQKKLEDSSACLRNSMSDLVNTLRQLSEKLFQLENPQEVSISFFKELSTNNNLGVNVFDVKTMKQIGGIKWEDEKVVLDGCSSKVFVALVNQAFVKDEKFECVKNYPMVLKVLHIGQDENLDIDGKHRKLLKKELPPKRLPNHRCIIQELCHFKGSTKDLPSKFWRDLDDDSYVPETLIFVLPKGEKNMLDVIKRRRSSKQAPCFSGEELIRFSIELLDGIEHLHKFRICHRDLKKGEKTKYSIVIADFGCHVDCQTGFELKNDGVGVYGSNYFSPPECHPNNLEGTINFDKYDVFSAGIIIYMMITGNNKIWGKTEPDKRTNQLYSKIPFNKEHGVSEDVKKIIRGMTDCNPKKRLSSEFALSEFRKLLAKEYPEKQNETGCIVQ